MPEPPAHVAPDRPFPVRAAASPHAPHTTPPRPWPWWCTVPASGAAAGATNGLLLVLGLPQQPVAVDPVMILAGACHGGLLALSIGAATAGRVRPGAGWGAKPVLLLRALVLGMFGSALAALPFLGVPDGFLMPGPWLTLGLCFGAPVATIVSAAHWPEMRTPAMGVPHVPSAATRLGRVLRFAAAGAGAGGLVWANVFTPFQVEWTWVPTGVLHGALFGAAYAAGSPHLAPPTARTTPAAPPRSAG